MSVPVVDSYKFSHSAPAKGGEYEHYYETNEWQRYVWRREQSVLKEVLTTHCASQRVDLLDFACGTGRVSCFLENDVATATGVDVSESMLSVAKGKSRRTRWILGDITEADVLGGRRFNLITAFRFFANAEPQLRARVMSQLAQLLTDDGVLVFNNHQNAWAPFPLASYLHQRWSLGARSTYRVLNPIGMRRLCRDAGLKIVRTHGIGLWHLPKIKPSFGINQFMEKVGRRLPPLRLFAQDILVVCRRRA